MGRHKKLTEEQKQRIEIRYMKEKKTLKNAGLPFGISAQSVLNLLISRGAIIKGIPREKHYE